MSADLPDADAQPIGDLPSTRRGFVAGALALGGATAASVHATAGAAPRHTGEATVNPRLFTFVGGSTGDWSVTSIAAVTGERLAMVDRVDIVAGNTADRRTNPAWTLRGVTSNERYVTRDEKKLLVEKQAALGRATATHAALIPIRKNAKWWALTQDERRDIIEEQSRHVTIGLKYLPAIARRLHHCRDLSESEPFDFLTLFDYAPADATAFDDMLAVLRATEEWKYIEREVDIRLERRT